MAAKSTCRDCGVTFYYIQRGRKRTRCNACRKQAQMVRIERYFSKGA